MEKILIVSGNKAASEALLEFIRGTFKCSPKIVESAYQAKTHLESDLMTELVMINSPLLDESGVEFAEYVTGNTAANCILLIKSETAEKIEDRAEKAGIIVVGRPFSKSVLYQIVRTIDIAVSRSAELFLRNARLEEKIDEIQTIDKAKFMLMEYKGMTESEAHTYIEQYAMNKRKKKSLAAAAVIDKLSEQYL